MSGRSASKVFQPVKPALDVPALEREVADRWRREDTEARYLVRNAAAAQRFLPRWADHGQQPDGRPPRLGPHVQGPVPAPHHARRAAALPGQVRLPGTVDRGRGRARAGVHEQARHRGLRHRPLRRAVQGPVQRFADRITEQSRRLGYWMDWDHSYFTNSDENNFTIWRFLQRCRGARAAVPRPRRHAVVSSLWHWPVEHGDRDRGYRELRLLGRSGCRSASPGHEHESLLVWTTTPWTLSSNVAAAVHPDCVRARGRFDGGRWWVSRARSIEPHPAPLSSGGEGERTAGPSPTAARSTARAGRRRAHGHRLGRGDR